MTTITLPRAVVEQALEALKVAVDHYHTYHGHPGTKFQQAIDDLRAALAQQANHLTIERLRDALVASRIIDPAAVEDPDGYDDGLMLHRIEALYWRLT